MRGVRFVQLLLGLGLQVWEKSIRIWEKDDGRIVGVVHTENEEPGEGWIQIHPECTDLYGEMVTYIEQHLADEAEDIGYVKLYLNDNSELEQIACDRGYKKLKGTQTFMEYTIAHRHLPGDRLPTRSANHALTTAAQ